MTPAEKIPVNIRNVILNAIADPRVTNLTQIRTLFVIGGDSDEHGKPKPDANGNLITDPDILSVKLGITKAAVFRTFGSLQKLGYIDWQQTPKGIARKRGEKGRVRILVPSS